jgi:adenylate cyclase, class 2
MIIEKEVKFEVDLAFIRKFLKNPKFKKEFNSFQRTVRRDTANLDLAKRGVFLRTRSDVKNVITLKKKNSQNTKVYERQEYETEVKDIKVVEDILEILGFDDIKIMEKYRIQGKFGDVTIVFDELPFGLFMEIEGDEESILSVFKELDLDFEKRIVKTYWDLWEEYKKKNKMEDKKDILFEGEEILLNCN